MKKFDLRMVSLTRGGEGSTLFSTAERFDAEPSDTKVIDTVGAGDAYASVVAAGYLRGLNGNAIVKAASDFSGKICGIPGALPVDADFYREIISAVERG
jgi:fructokinase